MSPKWLGITNRRALLAREKNEDTLELKILLCESSVATHKSFYFYPLLSCDSHILYRLLRRNFDSNTCSCVLGGAIKKLLPVARTSSQVEEALVWRERTV